MTQPAKHSSTPGAEFLSSNRNNLRDLLSLSETRKAIFIYLVGMGLLLLGGGVPEQE